MKFGFRSGTKSSKTNIDSNLNPFAKPANNDGNKGGDNNGNNSPPNNQQQQQPDPNSQFQKFCRDNGMFEGLDLQGFMKAVADGDTDKAGEFFMQSMLATARVAMAGADKLATAKMQKAMEETALRANAMTSTQLLTQEMHERLGFTRDPALAPMAEDVLNRFLAKGESAETALENTEKYFKQFALAAGSKFGLQSVEQSMRPGSQGFRGSQMQQNDNDDGGSADMDWIDVLTSGAHSANASEQNSNGGSSDGNANANAGVTS